MVGFRRRTLKLDSFILLLIQKYGYGVLVFGIILYVLVEGGLDIVTDIISHKIIKKIDKDPE